MNKKLKQVLKELQEKQKAISSANPESTYHADYEKEPIGGTNPYWRCVHCQRTDPQINGRIEGHSTDCEYRLAKEQGLPY